MEVTITEADVRSTCEAIVRTPRGCLHLTKSIIGISAILDDENLGWHTPGVNQVVVQDMLIIGINILQAC